MINTTNNYKTAVKASKRHLKAKAELFSGSFLVNTYKENDKIKIKERVGNRLQSRHTLPFILISDIIWQE